MIASIKTDLWKQFGAAIDMFENAIEKCPDELWEINSPDSMENIMKNYWYIAFHTLFFLDYYLDTNPADFKTRGPLNLSEEEMDEIMPERTLTKAELLQYVVLCREKARKLISGFTEESFSAKWSDRYRTLGMLEMQFYNMRHVQHHTGQLNMLLGKIDHDLPVWVSQTKVTL